MTEIEIEMASFDKLPKSVRDKLNDLPVCVNPNYILDRCMAFGEKATLQYIDEVLGYL